MSTTRRRLLGALSTGVTIGLAGCSQGTGGTTGTTDTTTVETTETATTTESTTTSPETTTSMEPTTAETSTESESATASVAIPGFEFSPIRIGIDPGTTVEWTNQDSAGHNVVSDQFHEKAVAWEFESATLSQGESTSYTFEESGVYEYFCSIHGAETMSGAVLVGDVSLEQDLPSEGDGGGY